MLAYRVKIKVDDVYTSTGIKYLKHLDRMKILQETKKASPITLQVALTDKCNLKCSFCSVANRNKNREWDYDELIAAVDIFIALGIETIEITGGGEPTLYSRFREFVTYCQQKGLKIGLITNGTMLMAIQDILPKLIWIRISMNTIDYIYPKQLLIPKIPRDTTLGFSYVADNIIDLSGRLNRIVEYTLQYKPDYVRVVPNCRNSIRQMKEEHFRIQKLIEPHKDIGFFYQAKNPQQGGQCLVGYFKPYLYTDGYVFPCSSVVLNSDSEVRFNAPYRWYFWQKAKGIYSKEVKPINGITCDKCVFEENNRLLRSALYPIKHAEFV